MIQEQFAKRAIEILKDDISVVGLAVGGSWLTDELDEYSDLDLILVTEKKIAGDKSTMLEYAKRLGHLLTGFTGEHVGEPRVLICLYDNPLLHVDIKFLTPEEFHERVEAPIILLDKDGRLQNIIEQAKATFPYPDYQWIEDRFWTWIHYALLKIGRGEFVEAFDFLGYLRQTVLGPLLHIKNGNLPRGVRKVETQLTEDDLEKLRITMPQYSRSSLLACLQNSVTLYKELRSLLFMPGIHFNSEAEQQVMEYYKKIRNQNTA